ncbi:MAG: formate/nitrite transporter family protein [Bacillota bacterium]|jgi:formate/nitrite transporter
MNYLTPVEIAETCMTVGQKKASLARHKILILGVLAGAYIAFGANLATVVSSVWPPEWAGLGTLFYGLTFSLGLVLVVLAGAELFTGNNMFVMLSFLCKKVSFVGMWRNWLIVFAANFIGTLLLVLLLFFANFHFNDPGLTAHGTKAVSIAINKLSLGWEQAFFRAILCNWLVCLAIWLAFSAKDNISRIAGIMLPITAFVACGFEHSVANMFFIPMGLTVAGAVPPEVVAAIETVGLSVQEVSQILNWKNFLVGNLLPVTLGNIVGGTIFVALFYWLAFLKKDKIR